MGHNVNLIQKCWNVRIYKDIVNNKELTDKQFCLYGYLSNIARNTGVVILTDKEKKAIKKLFKYRYYHIEDDVKDTALSKDIKTLFNLKLIKKFKLIPKNNKEEEVINKDFLNYDWEMELEYVPIGTKERQYTQLPAQLFTTILEFVKDFKMIRYIYYLYGFYNQAEVDKRLGVSNIFVCTNTINKEVCKGDEHKRLQMNNVLEKLKLIKVNRQKKNCELNINNIYDILIENIINFNPEVHKLDKSKFNRKRKNKI